ncbi:Glutathione synthase/RimK-type ligase, ATP-grasp superfamily [Brevibacterium iodinum ATCC 49514]|uniref:Glutathione synthase/RimK-type ligase, ATP-grasp superfamily n=2 Tax=Brevibacterium iodinum TaxID=31943 RepID=A0A2H1JF16_9MICO|nr:Glutathione synthase/RimK-type ligase, ATP-grasp superfamily [Brevibacterium iodinum ATCC 49514]SUW11236.1 Glutathione synthase/Ribosomal protein S6 modification enzyme (glutaminyl transferase) [Brevibacterium iodinum]
MLPVGDGPAVHVIHDNPEWIAPFTDALDRLGVAHVEWLLPETTIDLAAKPPAGLFWSRLSASAHTRTDPHVKEYGRAVLDWLAAAGRRMINGRDVYEIEVSKIRQHRELAGRGFDVPRTAAAFGPRALVEAAAGFTPPFITKHNQGGKGLGVRRFDSHAELEAVADEFAPGGANAPIDGITLIQEYVQPAQPFITRAEFIGGRFHYAVRVDVSGGSFELCPADACTIPGAGADPDVEAVPQFARREEITAGTPLISRLETLLTDLGIEIAGIEFIDTVDGRQVVYDINTNTNYNPSVESAEKSAGRQPAADRIADFIAGTLAEAAPQSVSPAGPAAR